MCSIVGLDMTKDFSFFTVPAVLIATCMGPHLYAVHKAGKSYDNACPRGFKEGVEKSDVLDKTTKRRIMRAQAASDNGFETLGLYAAGVVAARVAGVNPCQVNGLTAGYLAARMAYVAVYVHLQEDRRMASLRTAVWLTSIGLAVSLWVRAGLETLRR
ncbi:hypothetical protein CDD82_7686 [Ophiocordyceps australis]|uniref:MAPEG family protein n=1 Tax=Ophiocordyceps australis TaxID=1399860 RepID=A0A2C5ZPX8_9HYPO|nr:hypothetical protein CDD82_7686 [Ophiocordyceps australis]